MILKTSKTIPDRLDPAPPAIGSNGNWWAYDSATGKYTDTGVKAQAKDGKDGTSQYTKTVVDARDLDPDTYYPVTFDIVYDKAVCDFICRHGLGDRKSAPWMTHTLGFSMDYAWEDSMSGWQGGSLRKIHRVKYGFTSVIPAGDIGQNGEYSKVYIYVRGGGRYYFTTGYRDGKPGSAAVLHTEDYVFGKEPYVRTLPLKTSVTLPETEEKRLERLQNEKAAALRDDLKDATKTIDTLKAITTAIQKGELDPNKLADIQYLLDALTKGTTQTAGGLQLTNVIALSNIAGAITAYLSGVDKTDDGNALAMLKAGVRNFGQATETESVAINHDGTAHFGQQYLNGDRLDYKDSASATPYMSIGKGVVSQTIDQVLSTNNVDSTTKLANVQVSAPPASQVGGQMTVTQGKSAPIYVANDNTAVTITLRLHVETGQPDNQYAMGFFSASFLSAALGSTSVTYKPINNQTQFETSGQQTITVTKTIMAPKGTHYIDFQVMAYPKGATGSATGISVHQVYKTDLRQVLFGDRGLRILQASLRRFLDIDFSRSASKPFIQIGGGLQVDSINGGLAPAVLAYGRFNRDGRGFEYKSVGDGALSISKIQEGGYKITYPTSWGTSLAFLGSVNDDEVQNCKVAFSKAKLGYVYVATSDDPSFNDAGVYFQILKWG